MYKNIDAARTLGVSNAIISKRVKRKGLKREVFEQLMRGKFTPTRPNDFFITRIAEINRDLNKKEGVNIRNPYLEAISDLNNIIRENRNISLSDGEVRFFENAQPVEIAPTITSQQSNINPIVNSPISGASANPAVLGSSGTNQNLTKDFRQLSSLEKDQILFNKA